MAGTKEIRLKIKSIQGTRKITKAMEMVAASKMRKAQERMRQFRPYGDKIRNIVAHLAMANPEYRPPFLQKRDTIKSVGIILVTTDKGLCGGLNTNIQRAVLQRIKELDAQGVKVHTTAIGNRGFGFLQRLNASIVSYYVQIGDRPHLEKLIGPVKALIDMYADGRIDAVYVAYSRFINTMKQEPVIEQLVPLSYENLRADRGREARLLVGLHLRARCAGGDRCAAGPLRRGADLPGGRGEHGVRAERAHGGDEGGVGQREEADRGTAADLQQDAAGRHHEGNFRDSGRRRGGVVIANRIDEQN